MVLLVILASLRLSLLPAASPPVATPLPLVLSIDPSGGTTFAATLTGPAGGARPGEFRGRVSLCGSPTELPVSGRAARAGGRLSIRTVVRYADVPVDWSARYRPFSCDVRVEGAAGGTPVVWQGRIAWEDVAVSRDATVAGRFLSLDGIDLTDFAPAHSRALARLRVVNPFSFPLRIASSQYRLLAEGREVGRGATRGLLVRGGRTSEVDFPLDVDHAELLAAAGGAILGSGEVDAQLRGFVTIRLAGGDIRIPLDLSAPLAVRSLWGSVGWRPWRKPSPA